MTSSPSLPSPDGDDEPDVDVSGIAYFDQLGSDLVAAAATTPARPRRALWARPALLTGAAAATATVAFVGLQLFGSASMVEAIDVQQLGDRTVITVDELIDDPEAVQAELAAAGIAANIRGVLTPPSQVGALIIVAPATADDVSFDIEVEDRDGDGSLDLITIPEGFAGSLELGVGVSGGNDLGLESAGAPANCEQLIFQPVGAVIDDLRELSDDISWRRNTVDGYRSVDEAEIPPTDVIVELLVLPGGRLDVTTTDDLDRIAFSASPCEM